MENPKSEPVFRIPNPNLHAEPTGARYQDLIKYRGVYDRRRATIFKNFKGSWKFLAGSGALVLFAISQAGESAQSHIHGSNNNGGTFLNLTTYFDDEGYYYNREFQKFRYLSDRASRGNTDTALGYELANLGVHERNHKPTNVAKRAPHYKYF